MDDLISRQDAVKSMTNAIWHYPNEMYAQLNSYEMAEALARDGLMFIPSAQKKGHWNFVGDNLFKCTCCGKMYTTQQLNGLRVYDKDPYCPFFCPHCGADMRGDDNG